MEFKKKNDYSVTFFFNGRSPLKWDYVNSVYKATQDVKSYSGGSSWIYVNVYSRRSKRFLKRFYPSDNIYNPV